MFKKKNATSRRLGTALPKYYMNMKRESLHPAAQRHTTASGPRHRRSSPSGQDKWEMMIRVESGFLPSSAVPKTGWMCANLWVLMHIMPLCCGGQCFLTVRSCISTFFIGIQPRMSVSPKRGTVFKSGHEFHARCRRLPYGGATLLDATVAGMMWTFFFSIELFKMMIQSG